jgi:hypothetical protein
MGVLLRFEHPPPWGELHWRFGRSIDLPPASPMSGSIQFASDRQAVDCAKIEHRQIARELIECPGSRHASAVEARIYARSERYPSPPMEPTSTSWRLLGFDAEAISNCVCGAGRVLLESGHSWGVG